MSLLTPTQIKQFIAENQLRTPEDMQDALKTVFADTLQAMLDSAWDTHLGDDKYAIQQKQTTMVGIEDQIIALDVRGMTTRDIQAHLTDLYGVEVSPTLVSQVTDKLCPVIQEWQQRPLAAVYPVVFLDAVHLKVRQEDRVMTKAAYIVVGITLEGYKDVLGLWIGEHESAKFWFTVFRTEEPGRPGHPRCRGRHLTGFRETIATVFPQTDIQKCIVPQIRNSLKYVVRSGKTIRRLRRT